MTEKEKKKKRKKRKIINPLSHFANVRPTVIDHNNEAKERSFPNMTKVSIFLKIQDSYFGKKKAFVFSLQETSCQTTTPENFEINSKFPPLPKNGKRVIDTVIDKDVDSAYKSAFDNQTFFEIVTAQTYGTIENYSVSKWSTSENLLLPSRQMHYEFPKTIAYTQHNMIVDQSQTLVWSKVGWGYGIDSIVRTTGVLYSDYFYLEIHTRLEKLAENQTKLVVIADIVWEKPCLIKSRIENETLSGTKKYYEVFEKELCSEVATFTLAKKTSLESSSALILNSQSPMNENNDFVTSSERIFWMVFILFTMSLFMMTFTLLKLHNSMTALSDRVDHLERDFNLLFST